MGSTKRKNRETSDIITRIGKRTISSCTLVYATFNVHITNANTPPTDVDVGFRRSLTDDMMRSKRAQQSEEKETSFFDAAKPTIYDSTLPSTLP
mmetsp:Transcript_303/g.462  ORF Transcript_303/g.462 Transcript_303/m.462 type:complete len:94 (-) Transcript_303:72-353(-)